jgi:hypothetical protein
MGTAAGYKFSNKVSSVKSGNTQAFVVTLEPKCGQQRAAVERGHLTVLLLSKWHERH